MRIVAAAMVVLVASPSALAQVPEPILPDSFASETEWRGAYRQTEQDLSASRKMTWIGAIVAVAGVAVMAYGEVAGPEEYQTRGLALFSREKVSCRDDPLTGVSVCTRETISEPGSVRGTRDWRIFGPGLAVFGGGAFFGLKGWSRMDSARENLQRLEWIGEDRGWSLSLAPRTNNGVALRLAFRW